MTTYKAPTPDDHHRFLSSFLFGGTPNPQIKEAVWRAYLDLSRTVHGVAKADPTASLRAAAHDHVESLVRSVLYEGPRGQAEFDGWHKDACTALCSTFASRGYTSFFVGQAQKWINMALKYALTLEGVGWLQIPEAALLRAVGHAPLDNFFVQGLAMQPRDGMPQLSQAWSRIHNYDEYFGFQVWLRSAFQEPPLDVEFHVWQQVSSRRRAVLTWVPAT